MKLHIREGFKIGLVANDRILILLVPLKVGVGNWAGMIKMLL